jgi:hypothetical protein
MCELEKLFKNCNAAEALKFSSAIMESHDISYIKELAETYGKLIPLIVSLQDSKNADDVNKKVVLSNFANFLSEVKLSGCRCGIYKTSARSPKTEEENGFVVISEDPRTKNDTVICKCKFCNRNFIVHTYESGISFRTEWKKCS